MGQAWIGARSTIVVVMPSTSAAAAIHVQVSREPRHQSALTPVVLMIFAHIATSAFRWLAKSAGEPG